MITALSNWTWWIRWVEKRTITEEGPFADTFVPDEYGGPKLDVKLIQQMIVVTQSGHMMKLVFGSNEDVMDNLHQTGMGIYIEAVGPVEEESYIGEGPSGEWVQWKGEINPTLSDARLEELAQAYAILLAKTEA
jgi:hypothetical protein